MATDQTESIAGRLIGPYHIATLIGKGGMGEVYLAHDTRLGRRIALKAALTRIDAFAPKASAAFNRRLARLPLLITQTFSPFTKLEKQEHCSSLLRNLSKV
jgi:serine/threonine protein kinase